MLALRLYGAEKLEECRTALSPVSMASKACRRLLRPCFPRCRCHSASCTMYTTNAIESLHYSLRKVLKGRGAFPNDEAIVKLVYMGLHHVAKRWTINCDWKAALNQLVILFGDRVPV